jgi:DNA-binding SARP family transcriptional activator
MGAIAAAGVIWSLDRRRREQAHNRATGQLIARNPPPVEAAERRARAVSGDEAMRWVDLGARYLSGLVEQTSLEGNGAAPSLVLMKVGQRGLEVLLSPTVAGRLGWFSPIGDGSSLVLDADIGLDDLEALAAERWTAWPALVSVGESQGSTVLLNLEYAGSISFEGPDRIVEAALASVALQLATQPWCDEMLAGLYAIGDDQTKGPKGPQWTGSHKAIDLAERLDQISLAHQELAGELSLSTLRAVACEALPIVAIAFASTPANALQCLAEAAIPERSGVVLAAAGPLAGAHWRVVLDDRGKGVLRGLVGDFPLSWDMEINCDREEVALLSDALGATSDHEGVPAAAGSGNIASVPDELIDIREDGGHPIRDGARVRPPERGDVEICILGPVDVVAGDLSVLEPSRRMAALGLLTYLAAHQRPVSADELASSLWPLDARRDNVGGPQRKTVMNLISRARRVLGYGAGGKVRLVYSPQGYRLSDDVTSDWARFEKYVTNAHRQDPPQAMLSLRRALELVRGEPFRGALSSQFFEWVASEHLDLTLSAKAVDVSENLGELALQADDFDTVIWAVEKGLELEPTREELFRLWMHAYGRTGRPAKVDDVYRRLIRLLRQRIHPLQEPQPESRQVWRTYTAAAESSALS